MFSGGDQEVSFQLAHVLYLFLELIVCRPCWFELMPRFVDNLGSAD